MSKRPVVAIVVALIVVAGAAGSWRVSRVLPGSFEAGGDHWALSAQEAPVISAYLYAGSHRAEAASVPCYCGCRDLGHGNLLDCFVTPRGDYEPHASACAVCLDELADLRRILDVGEGVEAARAHIDATYSGLGKPTNTP